MSRTRAGGSATKPSTGLDHARAQELLSEPALLRQIVATSECTVGDEREPADGLYVKTANLITGEGWISAGPGYRRHVLDGRMLIDVSAAVSWTL